MGEIDVEEAGDSAGAGVVDGEGTGTRVVATEGSDGD